MSTEIALLAIMAAFGIAILVYQRRTKGEPSTGSAVAGLDPATQINFLGEQIKGLVNELRNLAETNTLTRSEITTKVDAAIGDIKDVYQQGEQLNLTTATIATALKGSQQRGSWGELTLKKVAELAGLTKHVTFKSQETFKDEEDKDKTPDMTVYLADSRVIAVDAKAPDLNLDGEKTTVAKDLKKTITELSKKNYPSYIPKAIDFVVCFVPTESLLASALSEDPNLIEYALKEKILLTSPLTLLGMFKAIEFGWKQNDQIENVERISKLAQELCERVLTLGGHFVDLRDGLVDAVSAYNAAMTSVNSRLLPTVHRIKALGITTNKDIEDLKEVPLPSIGAPKISDPTSD